MQTFIQRLLTNWKTSSLGILSIIGGITRLAFAIKGGGITEEAILTASTTILAGLGFLFTRDSDKSSQDNKVE